MKVALNPPPLIVADLARVGDAERTAALEETNEMMSLEIAERRRAEEKLAAADGDRGR